MQCSKYLNIALLAACSILAAMLSATSYASAATYPPLAVADGKPAIAAHKVRFENDTVQLALQVLAPGKTVEAVRIDNLGGVSSLWRSDGRDNAAPLAVSHGGASLSLGSMPMIFNPGNTEVLLSLSFKDNGAFAGKNTDFRVTVFFIGGDRTMCSLSAAQVAQAAAPPAPVTSGTAHTPLTTQAQTVQEAPTSVVPVIQATTPTTASSIVSDVWSLMPFIIGIIIIIVLIVLVKKGLFISAKKRVQEKYIKIAEESNIKSTIKNKANEIADNISGAVSSSKKQFIDLIDKQQRSADENRLAQEEEDKKATEKINESVKALEEKLIKQKQEDEDAKRVEEERKAKEEKLKKDKKEREAKRLKQKQKENTRRNEFLDLCKKGSLQEINEAIGNGASLCTKNDNGTTALMLVVGNNPNSEVIAALIKPDVDVNAKDDTGWTLLMRAAEGNPNPEAITILIEAGADFDAKNDDGLTPLMLAAGNNPNPEILSALMKLGEDVNTGGDGRFPLLMLAAGGNPNPEVITALIEAGADVNAKIAGLTPLMQAALKNPNPKVVKALEKAGADFDAKDDGGLTPLMLAAGNNPNPEVVQAFIRDDRERQQALIQAKKKNRQDVVAALINVDAKN